MTTPHNSHLLPIADDIIFEKDAIQNALTCLNKNFLDGCGIVGFKISNMDKKDACPHAFMLIGNGFFNDILKRKLFCPEYRHFYADLELGRFAQFLVKFVLCEDALVTHFHPAAGYPPDKTHMKRRGEKWAHDHNLFLLRSALAMEEVEE